MKQNLLRLLLPLLLLLGAVHPALAQPTPAPPGQISYQGFLTDGNGNPLATNAPQNFTVYFKLWNDASASAQANLLWAEQQTVTVDRGFFTVLLGQGSPVSGAPNTNNLTGYFNAPDASSRFVGTTVLGISANEMTPRLRLLASPYSLLAANAINASNAVNATSAVYAQNATNVIGGSITASSLQVNGNVNATGSITGNGGGITNLNAANLASGTVADGRLSGNVAMYSRNGTFYSRYDHPQTFNGGDANESTAIQVSLYPLSSGNTFDLKIGVDVFHEMSSFSTVLGGDAVIIAPAGRNLLLQPNGSTAGITLDPSGRVGIGVVAPANLLTMNGGAYCNGFTWVNVSDRKLKEKFAAVSPRSVLEKLASMPIAEWQYKADDDRTRHIGPVAQDFHAAFGFNGPDDTHISTVDEEGVALVAIQGLNQKLDEKNAEIEKLKQSVDELRKMVQALAEKK